MCLGEGHCHTYAFGLAGRPSVAELTKEGKRKNLATRYTPSALLGRNLASAIRNRLQRTP